MYSFIFPLHIVDCIAVYSPDGLLSHPLFPADCSSDSELQWDLGRVALPDSALAHTQHAPTAVNNRLHQIQPNTFVILGHFCSFVSSLLFFFRAWVFLVSQAEGGCGGDWISPAHRTTRVLIICMGLLIRQSLLCCT